MEHFFAALNGVHVENIVTAIVTLQVENKQQFIKSVNMTLKKG